MRRRLAASLVVASCRAMTTSSREYGLHARGAVAVTVRRPPPVAGGAASYALIQRGKPPGQGKWSLPGGAIDVGEGTAEAARRELEEETGLAGLAWHPHPFTTSDAIYADGDGAIQFHYLIAQTFCEVDASTAEITAGDDALDARFWTLDEVVSGGERGDVAGNCERIIARAEELYAAGLLPTRGS